MKNRSEFLYELKEKQIGSIDSQSSIEESFQNITLRPILKFQNELLIQVFTEYCIKQKNEFFKLSVNKKLEYIENSLQRDMKFRDFLKGIVVGLMTSEEYIFYSRNASNLNKRLTSMLIERLKSQVQLIIFEN
ncbi:MAG: glyoxalase [Flavobacterium sp.]|nr:glyoxalase [Flavobacterium sp.]